MCLCYITLLLQQNCGILCNYPHTDFFFEGQIIEKKKKKLNWRVCLPITKWVWLTCQNELTLFVYIHYSYMTTGIEPKKI